MFLNIETYILRQICIFSCGYPPWICSWKPYHIVCRISFSACLVVNHWPAKTCNANSPDMWKQSELCCFYSRLVQAKIWAEFQHPPISGQNTHLGNVQTSDFQTPDLWHGLVLAPASRFCTRCRLSRTFHSFAFLTPEICIWQVKVETRQFSFETILFWQFLWIVYVTGCRGL